MKNKSHRILKPLVICIYFIFCVLLSNTKAQINNYLLDSTYVNITTIVDSSKCDVPWDIAWGGDNRLWFTNRSYILAYNFSTQKVDTVFNKGSGNYLGLTFHPNFKDTPEVFIAWDTAYYYATGTQIRVFKYVYDSAMDVLFNEQELIRYFHQGEHSGGRLVTTLDRKLLITTNDYVCTWDTSNNYYNGKVLRMNFDGTIPTDNPTMNNYLYTIGHRNAQGIIQLPSGSIYVSELGANSDELNLLIPGKYYGWPASDGYTIWGSACNAWSIEFPIDAGMHPPSGIDWYSDTTIPEFNNCILESVLSFGGAIGGVIAYRLNSAGDSVVFKNHYFIGSGMKRIRDVAVAPDGSVYVISNDRAGARIRKIERGSFNSVQNYNSKKSNLFVYPNPASNEITIDNLPEGEITVEIKNIYGATVLCSNKISPENNKINIEQLPAGLYYLHINGSSSELAIKWFCKID
ncbi:MAG: PQQ-dependent sugar dehydrogenase [Bacteroidetes bacterium]|nr:PQQ-dependent sugar dehydrogenase [Bacteroidota bacterium]